MKKYSPPQARSDEECSSIAFHRQNAFVDAQSDFRDAYKKRPSTLFVVAKQAQSAKGTLFVLRRICAYEDLRFYVSQGSVRNLDDRAIVTVKNKRVEYFDTIRMKNRRIDVDRIRAKLFVSYSIGSGA